MRAAVPEDERRRQTEVAELLGRTRLLELLQEQQSLTAEEQEVLPQLQAFVKRECPEYFSQVMQPYLQRSLTALIADPARRNELEAARRVIRGMRIPRPAEWTDLVARNPLPPADPAGLKPGQSGLWMMVVWGSWSQTGQGRAWGVVDPSLTTDDRRRLRALSRTFDRNALDPAKLAALAKAAGCDGVVLVTRHLDGVPLFAEKQISEGGKAKLDGPLTHLVSGIRAQGLKVGLYYCLASSRHADSNWWPYHPNYVPGMIQAFPDRWKRYELECLSDLQWLVAGYQPDILWTDERWPAQGSDRLWRFFEATRRRNPNLQLSDRGTGEFANFVTPDERALKEALPGAWHMVAAVSKGPGFWYRSTPNTGFKDAYECIRLFVECRGAGGNLTLSVGPDGQGAIPAEEEMAFRDLGQWLEGPGKALRAGATPLAFELQPKWGKSFQTKEGQVTFVYGPEARKAAEGKLTIAIPNPPKRVRLTGDKAGDGPLIQFEYDARAGVCRIATDAVPSGRVVSALRIEF